MAKKRIVVCGGNGFLGILVSSTTPYTHMKLRLKKIQDLEYAKQLSEEVGKSHQSVDPENLFGLPSLHHPKGHRGHHQFHGRRPIC